MTTHASHPRDAGAMIALMAMVVFFIAYVVKGLELTYRASVADNLVAQMNSAIALSLAVAGTGVWFAFKPPRKRLAYLMLSGALAMAASILVVNSDPLSYVLMILGVVFGSGAWMTGRQSR